MSDSRALTTWEAFTRSALLSLGLDQALIDFLECTAIGVAAVLLNTHIRRSQDSTIIAPS